MKNKLLVVAGAGASVEFGMPSVRALGILLEDEAQKSFSLADDGRSNLYSYVIDEVTNYYSKIGNCSPENISNFEEVMHIISCMGMFYSRGVLTSPLGAIVKLKKIQDVIMYGRRQVVNENVWRELGGFLSDAILDEFRVRCSNIEQHKKDALGIHKRFFTHLRDVFDVFDVSVVTLNYDNLIYRSLENLISGFDSSGEFNEGLIFNRKEWACILHLHGSVHFKMTSTQGDLHNICWENDIPNISQSEARSTGPILSNDGLVFPNSVIIAGHSKSRQLMRRPFRTYYSELDRLVYTSDALLCLGYGFGDMHLNLALGTYRDYRQRPVTVVDWAEDTQMSASVAGSDGSNLTISRALQLFHTGAHTMQGYSGIVPNIVKHLKEQKTFDVSNDLNKPIAIWYNGMLSACENPEMITKRLT